MTDRTRADTPDDLWAAWRRHVENRARREGQGEDWTGLGEIFGDPSQERMQQMQDRIDGMEHLINGLLDRVAVLERMAVTDEARLAAEIEKLRS